MMERIELIGKDLDVAALSQLSLARKAQLTAGADVWSTVEAPEIGLESLVLSDGPNGVRGRRLDERDVSHCTPSGPALAASWDKEIARRVGALVGDEATRLGVHVVLGPTINILRSPLAGRNFECFSEDPLLAGAMAGAWIEGVQSQGVAATAKHFVCNEAETDRMTVDSVVDDRALREIYLLPFEYAVRAGVWATMTAYNRVNGSYVNRRLVTDVLKREWAWDGLAMSDWEALGSTVGWANGGLDLEMPGPGHRLGSALVAAIEEGTVDAETLDDKVKRLLRLAVRTGRVNGAERQPAVGSGAQPEGNDVLTEAAAAGFVLLKNENRLLPLREREHSRIAVIGPNASDPAYQGGGAAHVNLGDVNSPLDAIRERFGSEAEIVHEPGCAPRLALPPLHRLDVHPTHGTETHGLTVEYLPEGSEEIAYRELRRASSFLWWRDDIPGIAVGAPCTVRVSTTLHPDESGRYLFSLLGSNPTRLRVDDQEVVTFTPEPGQMVNESSLNDARGGKDLIAGVPVGVQIEMQVRPNEHNYMRVGAAAPLPPPDEMMERAVEAAAGADAVVLIVGTSVDVECEERDRETTALPGGQDELIRRVTAANPATVAVVNAAAPVDLGAARSATAVLWAGYPGEAFAEALADVLSGSREPGGRLPFSIARRHEDYAAWDTDPDAGGRLEYLESIFVGYRHFDASEIEPEFCFGHGLGYGEWEYEGAVVSSPEIGPGDSLGVEVTVRNVGGRRSKEVVQLYVADLEASVPRPPIELKAFGSIVLDPGQAGTVSLELEPRAFAFWDTVRAGWLAEPGRFDILIGRSSRDVRLREHIVLRRRPDDRTG